MRWKAKIQKVKRRKRKIIPQESLWTGKCYIILASIIYIDKEKPKGIKKDRRGICKIAKELFVTDIEEKDFFKYIGDEGRISLVKDKFIDKTRVDSYNVDYQELKKALRMKDGIDKETLIQKLLYKVGDLDKYKKFMLKRIELAKEEMNQEKTN